MNVPMRISEDKYDVICATPSPRLGCIDGLSRSERAHGTGIYTLTGFLDAIGPSGQRYLRMTLEDATGRITGYAWPECTMVEGSVGLYRPVVVTGQLRRFGEEGQLNIRSLAAAQPGDVVFASDLLPLSRCPDVAHGALRRLRRLERELPEPLRALLRDVLLDSAIGIAFMRCRASVRHHHAYPGGLLTHSTEMLDRVGSTVRTVLPRDELSPCVAQLAYLLHDLGKLRSVGESRRPLFAFACRHELMTIELLAPHLRLLERNSPELAASLRCILDHLATPPAARPRPKYLAAEVVATMDQWSAAAFSQRDMGYLLARA